MSLSELSSDVIVVEKLRKSHSGGQDSGCGLAGCPERGGSGGDVGRISVCTVSLIRPIRTVRNSITAPLRLNTPPWRRAGELPRRAARSWRRNKHFSPKFEARKNARRK